jgi:hypothetical protein
MISVVSGIINMFVFVWIWFSLLIQFYSNLCPRFTMFSFLLKFSMCTQLRFCVRVATRQHQIFIISHKGTIFFQAHKSQALVSFKKYMPPPLPFGYSHFRSVLNWFRNYKKRCFKNQMSVIWSWTYFYNLHWNNYLYFKGLLYIWEEMIMMALLNMAGLENSECIWKIQRKPEVVVQFQWLKNKKCDFRWIFLSNSSEGGPGIYIINVAIEKRNISGV